MRLRTTWWCINMKVQNCKNVVRISCINGLHNSVRSMKPTDQWFWILFYIQYNSLKLITSATGPFLIFFRWGRREGGYHVLLTLERMVTWWVLEGVLNPTKRRQYEGGNHVKLYVFRVHSEVLISKV